MKKILFFETPEFTGATRVTRTIAKTLQGKYEVVFAIVDPNNDNLRCNIEDKIKDAQPQILFSSFVCINPVVIEVGKRRGLFVVIRQDYNLRDLSEQTKQRVFETYHLADYVIAQTLEMKLEMLAIKDLRDCKIKVFENPLDKEDILKKASDPCPFEDNGNFHFLWVGRQDPIKGLPILEKAFEIVNEQYLNTDLTLVSNDSNPYRWINHSDCVVISSLSEASPNVMKEALFLGTQVVSTDCSPTVRRSLPEHRIARVGDSKDLAEKMISVIKDSGSHKLIN